MKKESYGKQVDIYALGIIYFEMNRPFGTETERGKVAQHINKFAQLIPFCRFSMHCVAKEVFLLTLKKIFPMRCRDQAFFCVIV